MLPPAEGRSSISAQFRNQNYSYNGNLSATFRFKESWTALISLVKQSERPKEVTGYEDSAYNQEVGTNFPYLPSKLEPVL